MNAFAEKDIVMSIKDETKDKMRGIRARNKLRAEAHLPQLSVTDELRKMNEHEVEMDFEALVQQEYSKYRHIMPGVKGFNLNLMRDRKIRELILQDFVKKRRS